MSRLHVPSPIRWGTYIGFGIMLCLAFYLSVPTWWGKGTVILLVLSAIFYGFFEPGKRLSHFAICFGIGTLIATLIAWRAGRLNEEADVVFALSITFVIWAIRSGIKKGG